MVDLVWLQHGIRLLRERAAKRLVVSAATVALAAGGIAGVGMSPALAASSILGTTGSDPYAIAVDSAGNVYTANQGSDNVSKITPAGSSSILGTTGSGPNGIAVDSAGNVYTSNTGSDNVSKITPAGSSSILGTTGSLPYAIAVDSAGNVYTANSDSDDVSKITPAGSSSIFGTTGSGPFGIAVDSAGNAYTANHDSDNVSKITPSGPNPTPHPVPPVTIKAGKISGSGTHKKVNLRGTTRRASAKVFIYRAFRNGGDAALVGTATSAHGNWAKARVSLGGRTSAYFCATSGSHLSSTIRVPALANGSGTAVGAGTRGDIIRCRRL